MPRQDQRHNEEFKKFCDSSNVAFTNQNFQLMRRHIIAAYSLQDSIDTILRSDLFAAVYFQLKDQLEHVPPPTPARPVDRRPIEQQLYEAGIRKSSHLSYQERLEIEAKKKAEAQQILDLIRQSREQWERKAQIQEAKNIYVQAPNGLGIDYYRTEMARKEALDKLNATPEERE